MGETQQVQDPRTERLGRILASQDIPQLYANGFTNAFSNADVITVLERNNSPVAVLNMSYTTAKSLAYDLSRLIADFERKSEQTIMTTDVVDEAVLQQTEEQS